MREPQDGRRSDVCDFMFHIVPRERYLSDELIRPHISGSVRTVIAALADRTAEHWPPADSDSDGAPAPDA